MFSVELLKSGLSECLSVARKQAAHSRWASPTATMTMRDGACVHDRACVPVRGRTCVPVHGRACVPVHGRIRILSSLFFFKLSHKLVWLYHRTGCLCLTV